MKKSKKQRKQQQQQIFDCSREEVHRNRARKLLEEGNIRHAREELGFVLKCNPQADIRQETAELFMLQGKRLFAQRDYHVALRAFQQAHSIAKNPNTAFDVILRCYVEIGDMDAAMTFCTDGFANPLLTPDNAAAFLKLLLLQGKTTEAREVLTSVPERFHERDRLCAEAVMILQDGNTADALTIFEKIYDVTDEDDQPQGDHTAAWYAYALILNQQSDRAFAIIATISDKALRGGLYLHHHKHTDDPESLQYARNDNPALLNHRQSHLGIVQELEEVLDTRGFHEAGHALVAMEDDARKLPIYTELAASIYSHAAEQALRESEISCALEFWNHSLQLRADDLEHHLNVLGLTWLTGSPSYPEWVGQTLKLIDREAATNPAHWPPQQVAFTKGEISALLGMVYLEDSKPLRARAELEKALRDASSSPFPHLLRARLAEHDGELSNAAEYYDETLRNGLAISSQLYNEILDVFVKAGATTKAAEFRKRFGYVVDDAPESPLRIETQIYFALSKGDLRYIKYVADELEIENHVLLKPVHLFLNASDASEWSLGKKVTSTMTIEQVEDFLKGAATESEVISYLQYLSIALPIYHKTPAHKKVLAYLKSELSLRAENSLPALVAQVNIVAVEKKRPTNFQSLVQTLLNRSDRPVETLVELQRFALSFNLDNCYTTQILEWLRREPEHVGLLWAASTVGDIWYNAREYNHRGFEIARRLQDRTLLELYRLEEYLDELEKEFEEGRLGGFDDGNDEGEFDKGMVMGALSSLIGKGSSLEELFLKLQRGTADTDFAFMMQFTAAIVSDPQKARETMRKLNVPLDIRKVVEDIIRDVEGSSKHLFPKLK